MAAWAANDSGGDGEPEPLRGGTQASCLACGIGATRPVEGSGPAGAPRKPSPTRRRDEPGETPANGRSGEGLRALHRWSVTVLLAVAQFVMVLDSTVMNVSLSDVVVDLDSTVADLQTAITLYPAIS